MTGSALRQTSASAAGLTGMLERVRALSGTFDLLREDGRTSVRCRLPLDGGASPKA